MEIRTWNNFRSEMKMLCYATYRRIPLLRVMLVMCCCSSFFLPQFFAIFAFSTCGSYSGMFKIAVECKNRTQSDLKIEVEFEYPFRSEHAQTP